MNADSDHYHPWRRKTRKWSSNFRVNLTSHSRFPIYYLKSDPLSLAGMVCPSNCAPGCELDGVFEARNLDFSGIDCPHLNKMLQIVLSGFVSLSGQEDCHSCLPCSCEGVKQWFRDQREKNCRRASCAYAAYHRLFCSALDTLKESALRTSNPVCLVQVYKYRIKMSFSHYEHDT